jgi:hypothetical protein
MRNAGRRPEFRILNTLFAFLMFGLGSDVPARAVSRGPSTEISPPYTVTVRLQVQSPFIPDGRHSLTEISFKAIFPSVTFEFDPEEDPLLGRCQVNSEKGKGSFSRIALNDVQKGEERLSPRFLSARPREFSAGLAIESEPMAEDEAAARSGTAPEKVRLNFWTEWEASPIRWGSKYGTEGLPDFKFVFEVPFRELIQGKPFSVTLPYEGRYPEDKGIWTIDFRPSPRKKSGFSGPSPQLGVHLSRYVTMAFRQMKVIALLTNHSMVDRIINHLKLKSVADKPPTPHRAYQGVLMAAEASSEYFS